MELENIYMDEMTEKQEEATRIIEAIGTTTLKECYVLGAGAILNKMIIPIPIPMNLSSRGAQGVQLEPLQITQITEKPKYGTFTNHKKYDVIYIDASNDAFLIKDDENDAVWIDFDKCKIV